jgi:hypothetical protein
MVMAIGWLAVGLLSQGRTSEDAAGSGTTTLAVSDAQFGFIELTGILSGNRIIKVPNGLTMTGNSWVVKNSTTGNYSLTFAGASGNGVVIARGKSVQVYFDGTNMVVCDTDFAAAGRPGVLSVNTADSAAIASTAAETNFSLNALLLQDFLTVGRVLRITASGKASDTGTPTLDLKLKAGSVTLLDLTAITLPSGITDKQWTATFLLVCRSTGVTGTVQTSLIHASIDDDLLQSIANVATIDTTATQTLQMSAQWSASSASNTVTQELLLVEVLN